MRSLLLVAGVAAPGVAFADAVVPADPAHSPGFVQIDRYDATSVAGGDVTYISVDGADNDVTLLRFQLGGRYVDQKSRFGGYVNMPIAYASGDGESLTALGNLEVGGIFLPKLGGGSTSLVFHAGLTLPTASDGEDTFANLFSIAARPQDVYLALPESTSVRLGASPMFRSGNVFGRVDVGLDINLDNSGDDTSDPVVHVNAGIGIDLGGTALMGELSNVYVLSDDDGRELSDKMINVFAVSARFNAGSMLPYVSLTIPLDEDATDAIDLAFTAGLEARL